MPGANHYKPERKLTSPRTIGNYLQKERNSGIIADATAHGMSVPANTKQYTNLEVYKAKAPKYEFKKNTNLRMKPLKITDLSPHSYKPNIANSLVKPRSPKY